MGVQARDTLRPGREGRLEAMFNNSFYVTFRDDWVCVGEAEIGRGPLNLLVDGSAASWRRLRPHTPVVTEHEVLKVGDLVLDLASATPWRPQSAPDWSQESLTAGFEALDAEIPMILPRDGLAAFIRVPGAPINRTARAAEPAAASISVWLAAPMLAAAEPAAAVQRLLGLGPGLTPSGDDFLAGILVTLRLLGRDLQADGLWAAIERCAPSSTSQLSLAHLRAANNFGLAEKVHQLLIDIIVGRTSAIRPGVAALGAKLHNSPWDALAGCLTVLRRLASKAGGKRPT